METPASSTAMSISNLPPLSLDLVEGGVASVSGTTMGGEEFDPDPHPHGLVQVREGHGLSFIFLFLVCFILMVA